MLFAKEAPSQGKRWTSFSNSSTRHCKARKAILNKHKKDIPLHLSRWHTGPGGLPSSASPPARSPSASRRSWPASPSCWWSPGPHLPKTEHQSAPQQRGPAGSCHTRFPHGFAFVLHLKLEDTLQVLCFKHFSLNPQLRVGTDLDHRTPQVGKEP